MYRTSNFTLYIYKMEKSMIILPICYRTNGEILFNDYLSRRFGGNSKKYKKY